VVWLRLRSRLVRIAQLWRGGQILGLFGKSASSGNRGMIILPAGSVVAPRR
jgi:hypothetical protein